ncbi:hypothetical protein BKA67DRAFT_648915 [Truncatella angustata]|uniref:Uncharacterized protein n=1 Tax=Truncatella angustata TaxID=152316 RepID=A0A9P8ZU83_9PEZI|nr:uncharacterized protein BKA67DRAFT_648915 [Truncatella angustata]KAH6648966.1 hypothetical protein BKA67DRAFT_648915 [Truncatella angustata]KAH8195584.1 hypothetical protein TruAng_010240 [Truncatella angustata]
MIIPSPNTGTMVSSATSSATYLQPSMISPSLISPSIFSSTHSEASFTNDYEAVRVTEDDFNRAEVLMGEHCITANKSRRPGQKEATAVLASVIHGKVPCASSGLVEALLEYGAEVCFERRKSTNILKMVMSKDQEDIRSDIFAEATRSCHENILLLLAQHADDTALASALPIAIAQNNLNKVTILMARGADASPLCSEFLDAIRRDSKVVSALLQRERGVCQDSRDKGLVLAASLGYARTVQILLDGGANVTHGQPSALITAIRNGKEDVVAVIASHREMRQHVDLLDFAVGEAYSHKQLRCLEACLQAGAKGSITDKTLLYAISHQQYELVDSLVSHHSSVDHHGGAAVVSAFKSGQPNLLQTVLLGKPSNLSMMAAIAQTASLRDICLAHRMVELLFSTGLQGDLSEILIHVLDDKMMVGDEQARYALTRILLQGGKVDVNLQEGRCLTLAVDQGWITIFNLLLQYQPSFKSLVVVLDHAMRMPHPELRKQIVSRIVEATSTDPAIAEDLKAAGVISAAKSICLDILKYLAQFQLSTAVISRGFAEMLAAGEQWLTPSGLEMVQFFLDQDIPSSSITDAFCQAARLFNRDACELLSNSTNVAAPNKAMESVTNHSQEWHTLDDRNGWIVSMLLEMGASGEPVNLAFLKVTSAFAQGLASETLLDEFLYAASTDVNFKLGETLKIAVRAGNTSLLKKLVKSRVSKETMTQAFAEVISTPLAEDVALALIKVLNADCIPENCRPDYRTTIYGRYPPIVDCLATYPESPKLVKRLVELGCALDTRFEATLYENTSELATALTWAMVPSEGKQPVSDAVIQVLIDANKAWSSALFYASREGDLTAVKSLLKVKFKLNDGSLHEAARNLHQDTVAALVKAKHDVNFPSSRREHDGRTPLQELAYMCDGNRSLADIEQTISALEVGKTDPLAKWQGKNPLFLALDHPQPYNVTHALLDTVMWRVINDNNNLFEHYSEQGTKLSMSPTIYLSICCRNSNSSRSVSLQHLLRTKHCVDRYFADSGTQQPPGAVGLPDNIAKEEKKRREESDKWQSREFEHKEKMRREWEDAQLKTTIDRSKHNEWQQHEHEKTAQKVNQSQFIHQTQIHQKTQVTIQQQEAIAQKSAAAEQSQWRERQQKLHAQQQDITMQRNKQLMTEEATRQRLLLEKRSHAQKLAYQRSMQRIKGQ